MTIEAAKPEQVFEIADSFGIDLSAEDAVSFAGLMNGIKASPTTDWTNWSSRHCR